MKAKAINVLFHIIEWFVSFVLVTNGLSLIFIEQGLSPAGPLASIFGADLALVIYGVLFLALGLTLIASKVLRKKRLHTHTLFATYLTSVFIFFIEWIIVGWGAALIDTAVVSLLIAVAYLRWKFRTQYITNGEFAKEIAELRHDRPKE